MISAWNKKVAKKDLVYIIGDFSFYDKEKTKQILARLNGRKILILGNHDKFRKYGLQDWIDMGFEDVKDEDIIKLSNGVRYLLKHYPYADNTWVKWFKLHVLHRPFRPYMALYPVDSGLWHIHGHYHGGPLLKGRQINVNADTLNFNPISESEIIRLTGI